MQDNTNQALNLYLSKMIEETSNLLTQSLISSLEKKHNKEFVIDSSARQLIADPKSTKLLSFDLLMQIYLSLIKKLSDNELLNQAIRGANNISKDQAKTIIDSALKEAGYEKCLIPHLAALHKKEAQSRAALWSVLLGAFGLISIVLPVIDMLGFYAPNLIGSAANFLGTLSLGGSAAAIPAGLVLLPFAILIAAVATLYLFKTFYSGDKTLHLKTAPPVAGAGAGAGATAPPAPPAPSHTSKQQHKNQPEELCGGGQHQQVMRVAGAGPGAGATPAQEEGSNNSPTPN